jgi:putative endonuclease
VARVISVFALKKKKSTTTIGKEGENIAAAWLISHGYTLVARNYRKRFGEVDIIASHDGYLVFIEVKTRASNRYGSPLEAVTVKKQRQLSRIAIDYLTRNKLLDTQCRFDVVSVILAKGQMPKVDVIVNAFEFIQ